ncbi:MAG: ArsR/SmtB family transcription factor [Pseudobdellovibrionaceae bacterium]
MRNEIKNQIYGHLSVVTKALSSPKRLEIIELLCQGEKTVETVAEQANLGVKNASAQLKELKLARLVDSRRDGKFVFYRLADNRVAKFWMELRSFAEERTAELQRIIEDVLSAPEALEKLNRKDLLSKARKGEILLIDVRPRDEFESAHIPFAVSVPADEISKHLKTFPKSKEIVAYCRGPYCLFAKEVVEKLRKAGFKATRLKDGVQEWALHGLPVESKGA